MGILDNVKNKIGIGRKDDWDDYDDYDDRYDDGYDNRYDDRYDDDYDDRYDDRYDDGGDYRDDDYEPRGGRSSRIGSFTPLVNDTDMRAQRSVSRRQDPGMDSRPDYESSLQMYKIESRDGGVGRASTHSAESLEAAREELTQLQQGIPVPLNSLENQQVPRAAQVKQPSTVSRRIVTITPTSYADAERVADAFRNGSSAVVAFTAIKPELAKRLLDFSFGVVSVSGGSVERIGEKVFFLSRGGQSITEAEKQQLRDSGIL